MHYEKITVTKNRIKFIKKFHKKNEHNLGKKTTKYKKSKQIEKLGKNTKWKSFKKIENTSKLKQWTYREKQTTILGKYHKTTIKSKNLYNSEKKKKKIKKRNRKQQKCKKKNEKSLNWKITCVFGSGIARRNKSTWTYVKLISLNWSSVISSKS